MMNRRILALLLCLCLSVGLLAGLTNAAAELSVTGIETAGKTQITVGESVTWTAKALPEGARTTLKWAAGNPGVATVDQNGKITSYKAGQCHITVSASNGVKKTVLLTVSEIPVTGIDTAGKTQIKVGESVTWTAKAVPGNATNAKLTWKAGNPGVATVDQAGRITPHKAGKCNITITAGNSVSKTILLTVVPDGAASSGSNTAAEGVAEGDGASASYVLNTNTMKFHIPGCSSVRKMKEKNKCYYSGSRESVIAKGYSPCKRCKP